MMLAGAGAGAGVAGVGGSAGAGAGTAAGTAGDAWPGDSRVRVELREAVARLQGRGLKRAAVW